MNLESHLRARRDDGRKLLVPYVTGGLDGWTDVVEAVVDAGADAVEIGIPFSDPVMDGPTIQAASQAALSRGATPTSILAEARNLDVDVPLAVMTYCNLVFHAGCTRFAERAGGSGHRRCDPARPPARRDRRVGGGGRRRRRRDGDARGAELQRGSTRAPSPRARAGSSTASRSWASPENARSSRRRPSSPGVGPKPSPTFRCCSASASRRPTRPPKPLPRPTASWSGSALIARLLDGEGAEGAHTLIAAFRAALDDVGATRVEAG